MYEKFSDVIELTRSLVKINSENPDRKEINVQKFLTKFLEEMGFQYELIIYMKDRNNIVAFFPPLEIAKKDKYILFSGHQDTVPGYSITRAETAPIIDGRIYGRGACDMKGGIAAFLTAISHFLKDYDLLEQNTQNKTMNWGICVIFTTDEEMGCEGIRALKGNEKLENLINPQFCINAEPTGLYPVIGHKGTIWFKIRFNGKAAHASVPELGENAIEKAARYILALEPLKKELNKKIIPEFPSMSPPTISVGIIRGGNKTNIIPDWCDIQIDRRLTKGETPESALLELKTIAKNIGMEEDIDIEPLHSGECYVIPNGSENKYYTEILDIVQPFEPQGTQIMNGYTEADIYYRYFKIPTLILGPGSIDQAHKADEYVEISQLTKASKIYYEILKKYVLK